MTRGVGGHSPANVQKYLAGIHYPASKRELIEKAEDNQAPPEVMQEIRDLPGDRYNGPQEVMKAYGRSADFNEDDEVDDSDY
jgi:hypothetical protein